MDILNDVIAEPTTVLGGTPLAHLPETGVCYMNIIYLIRKGGTKSEWIKFKTNSWGGPITTYKDLMDKVLLHGGTDTVLGKAWREISMDPQSIKDPVLCVQKPEKENSSIANLRKYVHWPVEKSTTEPLPADLVDLLKSGQTPESAPTMYLCIVCPTHSGPKTAYIWKPNSPDGCKKCKDKVNKKNKEAAEETGGGKKRKTAPSPSKLL